MRDRASQPTSGALSLHGSESAESSESELHALFRLPADELLCGLTLAVEDERRSTASLLAHLAAVDARKLFADEGFSSLHAYCVNSLGMDEEAAFRRIGAARLAIRYPAVLVMVADGRLHLSGLRLLQPYLDDDRCDGEELLATASGKTKKAIRQMLADRFPSPDVRSRVTPVDGLSGATEGAGDAPGRGTPSGVETSETVGAPGESQSPGDDLLSGFVAPLGAQRYRVEFMADEQLVAKLREAEALVSHSVRPGDLPALMGLALAVLIEQTRKKRFGAGSGRRRGAASEALAGEARLAPAPVEATDVQLAPAPVRATDVRLAPAPVNRTTAGQDPAPVAGNTADGSASSRYVPADVRSAVYERDGGRCSFVSADGHRCEETRYLQVDHIAMVCRGGQATEDNTRLLCSVHNRREAEKALGRDHIDKAIEERRRAASDSRQVGATDAGEARTAPASEGPTVPNPPAGRPPHDPVQRRILELLDERIMTHDAVVEEYCEDLANMFVVLDGINKLMLSNHVTYLPGGGARLVRADQLADHGEASATS